MDDNNGMIRGKSLQALLNDFYISREGVLLLKSLTKEAMQKKQIPNCPKLAAKNRTTTKRSATLLPAVPIGKKGHYNPLYQPFVEIPYLNQVFFEKYKLGEGSFGDVFLYSTWKERRTSAIKVVYNAARGRREVYNLDRVGYHSNCIQYENAWQQQGQVCIQLEIGMMSLAQYCLYNHHLEEEECWNVLFDILAALAHLHNQKLVHNDIKPANILIMTNGIHKLCDFGLLRDLNEQSDSKEMILSEGDGKYIAGEVLEGRVSTSSDIFALGISILEIAIDLILPGSGNDWTLLRTSSKLDIRTLSSHNIRSTDLEMTINWMMKQDPDKRPTAQRLLDSAKLKKHQQKGPRHNYLMEWCENSQENDDVVNICATPNNVSTAKRCLNFTIDLQQKAKSQKTAEAALPLVQCYHGKLWRC